MVGLSAGRDAEALNRWRMNERLDRDRKDGRRDDDAHRPHVCGDLYPTRVYPVAESVTEDTMKIRHIRSRYEALSKDRHRPRRCLSHAYRILHRHIRNRTGGFKGVLGKQEQWFV